jgi:quercetin dioxygenase-like cupin family protein
MTLDLLQLPVRTFGVSALMWLISMSAVEPSTPDLPDPLNAGWQGNPVCERLHEDDHQRVLRCSFAPGVGHERHYHAPHFGYALSGGRMRMTDEKGFRDVDLATGSSYNSEGVAWHEVLNIGETTVIYLIIEQKQTEQ